MQNNFHKNSLISIGIILILILQLFLGFNTTSASSDLDVLIESRDNFIVTSQRYAHIYVTANLPSLLTIRALVDENIFLIDKNVPLTQNLSKDITIPIVYPLDKDFSLSFFIETVDASKETTLIRKFTVKNLSNGLYSISGRIIKCSPTEKNGIEGAKIEVQDGPAYSFTYSEDDGYFTLGNLLKGTYKIKVSHECSSGVVEKIIVIGEKEAFIEVCLSTYGIPDIDLWLNKPSGSSFEIGETSTIFMRSAFDILADLYLEDEKGLLKPILLNKTLKGGIIHSAYWDIPLDESMGLKYLRLIPKEKNICGEAIYLINVIGNIRYGAIRGKVTCNGLPVSGASVYLPLQFTEHIKTDAFGNFEIKDVPAGIHTLRCISDGFSQVDLRGIQVKRGRITENVNIELVSEKVSFEIYPPKISLATYEHRGKEAEFELSLKEGFLKDIEIQKIECPEGIELSPSKIPLILKDKLILSLKISDKCPIGDYEVKFKIGNNEYFTELSGNVVVSGISVGTFDGRVAPNKIILPQGEEAKFKFLAEKYSNFSDTLELNLLNPPPYSQLKKEDLKAPPVDINFSIITSLSTPEGLYDLILEVKGDRHIIYFPFQLEVLKAGGNLSCVPENGWNPIFEPGETETIKIGIFTAKGVTENVRLNIDYGPPWLILEERNIGKVSEDLKYASLTFSPPQEVIPGGYNYSISFTYGAKNEGYLKFSGKVNLFLSEPNAPTNLRAKYVKEDSKIILTWGPPLSLPEGDIAGYNIYKSTHYPSFDSKTPINNTLIKDRYYEDLEFKQGKTYWYVVRAVDFNGNISPKSNTADVSIPSFVNRDFKFELEKGEGATYFLGERLNFYFQGNAYGTLEVRIIQDGFSTLILTKEVSPTLKYMLGVPTPGIYGKVKVQAKLTGKFGLSAVQEQEITIKKAKTGDLTIKGILWNSNYDASIPFVDILVYSGESFGRTTSKIDGSFEINGLANGTYTFLVNVGSLNILLDPVIITASKDLGKIELPYKKGGDLISWLPDNNYSVKREGDLRISYTSKAFTTIAIRVGSNFIFKDIVPFKEISPSRVYSEYIKIPKDLPSGINYLVIEDLKSSFKCIFPLLIEEKNKDGLSGIILDSFGNPLKDANVSAFSGEEKEETSSNEFGYFSFSKSFEKITVSKYGYSEEEVNTTAAKNVEVRLKFNKGEIENLSESITSSLDTNDIETRFLCKDGFIEDLTLRIVSKDEDTLFEKVAFDLFPSYLYELYLEGMSFEDKAKLEFMSSSDLIGEIQIEKGFKSKIFIDSSPEAILVDPKKGNSFELDFYSYGFYSEKIELAYSTNLKGLQVSFEPRTFMPGDICKVNLSFNINSEGRGYYLLNIILKDKEKKAIVPMYLYLKDDESNLLINDTWAPYLYVGSEDIYRFYFLKKPDFIVCEDVLEGASFYSGEDYIQVKLKAVKEGVSELKFNILIGEEERKEAFIKIYALKKKELSPLQISAKTGEDGVEINVEGLKENYSYFINRIKDIEGVNFLNLYSINEKSYIDKSAQEMKTYNYSLFFTDGLLGAGWSNIQKVSFRKLFLNINIKDGMITNKERLNITGSVPTYAKFTINGKLVYQGKNGTFSEIIYLKEGENKLIFKVEDEYGNELIREIKVILDSIPPTLELLNIVSDYIETIDESVLIRLKTERDAIVTINGLLIVVDKNGYAECLFKLNSGRNEILITATDLAGNQSKKILVIERFKKIIFIELKIGANTASVNGKTLTLDVPPQIINGRTLVPIRFISESFGAEVIWEASEKSIRIKLDNNSIFLKIGSNKALVNGRELILDVPPQIINGRTLVPIRFISESFGAEVIWEAEIKKIKITYKVF